MKRERTPPAARGVQSHRYMSCRLFLGGLLSSRARLRFIGCAKILIQFELTAYAMKKEHHFCPLENMSSKKASFLSFRPNFRIKIWLIWI